MLLKNVLATIDMDIIGSFLNVMQDLVTVPRVTSLYKNGPEPFCGVALRRITQSIRNWTKKTSQEWWNSQSHQRQAKEFIQERKPAFTEVLLGFNRKVIRAMEAKGVLGKDGKNRITDYFIQGFIQVIRFTTSSILRYPKDKNSFIPIPSTLQVFRYVVPQSQI
ncbi:unnamed protein product [Acanthoscelides obtectus]|uniref:Uncharacterized protein n=1 Tax=Acanthoscelides obtectus TaxID=200917 RepID=A0A9P0K6N4_ACAOB|nr:unnamed protein product [Acanthoscelides obtectus]CAK1683097.1 hypothetical protein AOBTE_LOCUS34074 [Acanthoscelides obtectus]